MEFFSHHFGVNPQNVKVRAEKIVDSILNWDTARLHDGHNISPMDWSRLPFVLRYSLQKETPDIWVRSELFDDLDTILMHTRNLTMLRVLATEIVYAHLYSYVTHTEKLLNEATTKVKGRVRAVERFMPEAAVGRADFHIAQMISAGDQSFERKRARADLERAQAAGLKLN